MGKKKKKEEINSWVAFKINSCLLQQTPISVVFYIQTRNMKNESTTYFASLL